MSEIKFMCVADAVRASQRAFDQTLQASIQKSVSGMDSEALKAAFFGYSQTVSAVRTTELLKAA